MWTWPRQKAVLRPPILVGKHPAEETSSRFQALTLACDWHDMAKREVAGKFYTVTTCAGRREELILANGRYPGAGKPAR